MSSELADGRPKIGRPKLWREYLKVTLAEGTIARIDAARHDGEDRLSVIRQAIEIELTRRENERHGP